MKKRETKKSILFVTSSLEATGSEILLFELINSIAERYKVSLICYQKGELIRALSPAVKIHILGLNSPKNLAQKIIKRLILFLKVPLVFWLYRDYKWYINTIVLPLPVKHAAKNGIEFILHVHELNRMFYLLKSSELRYALDAPKLLIANSRLTKQDLIQAGASGNISVINPFIDLKKIDIFQKVPYTVANPNTTWLMSGSIDLNKNPELFVAIALACKSRGLNYQFIWLYNSISDPLLFDSVHYKTKQFDLPIEFVKPKNNEEYLRYFSKADGFLLTSTSESFSIVTLEALAFSLALVVNDCGGVNETLHSGVASIISLGSDAETYIQAMTVELSRAADIKMNKKEIAQAFDKKNILVEWEKLLDSTFY
jgi:L-malate glycosyltransferase